MFIFLSENATFDGTFSMGFGENSLDYNVWSHEILGIPIRSISAFTTDGCYPFKHSLIGLVQNSKSEQEENYALHVFTQVRMNSPDLDA